MTTIIPTHTITHTVTIPAGCTAGQAAAALRRLPAEAVISRVVLAGRAEDGDGETHEVEMRDLVDLTVTVSVSLTPE